MTGPKRRILFLQSTSEIGGSDISLLAMIQRFDRSRFAIFVILPEAGPFFEKLQALDCRVSIMPEMWKLTTRKGKLYYLRYLWNYPFAVQKICRIIKENKIDLVHTNTLHNFYGVLAAQLTRRPHVWHVREIVKQSNGFGKFESFLARHFSTKIIVISDACGEIFYESGHKLSNRVVKISNGVDIDLFHPNRKSDCLRRDFHIHAQETLVGYVGRLDHWKGIDVFLKAAAVCRPLISGVRFLVIGGPVKGRENFTRQMKDLTDELNIKDIVVFTDWKYGPDKMPDVFASLNMLVLPSAWPEPFGRVLIEAMASAKPVIATDQGGPREICINRETSLLVPPQDPKAFATAIVELVNHPDQARAMGAKGRKRAEELYDIKFCVQQIQNLYDELLQTSETHVLSEKH